MRRADARHALTQEVINHYDDALFALHSLFVGSEDVSRQEFERVASGVLAKYPGIAALEWVPSVTAAQRPSIEAQVTRELGRPFYFTERNASGAIQPAASRPEYLPILYVVPLTGNEPALGYDLSIGPTRATLAQARQERRVAMTPLLQLVQEKTELEPSMIWARPVFADGPTGERFCGYVQAVFRVRPMLEQAITRHAYAILETLIVNPQEKNPAQRTILYHTGEATITTRPLPTEAEFAHDLIQTRQLKVGPHEWRVLYRPRQIWLQEQASATPGLGLGAGLLITGLLAGLFWQLNRQAQLIKKQVAEQTAALRESRRELEALIDELPGAVCRFYTDDQLTPIYIAGQFNNLTGFDPDEMIDGKVSLGSRMHPDDLVAARRCLQEAIEQRKPYEFTVRFAHKSGEERWLLTRGRPVYGDDGKVVCLEGLVLDFTAQHTAETEKLTLERKMLETQKLESLGVLAGGIAHDFNNLLTGIVGNVGLARLDLPPSSPVTPSLQQIESAALRAAELCQQLLAYSGKARFAISPIRLSELIESTVTLLRISISKQAQLHLELVSELPLVMADATQLRQIVMNLVINASDAIGQRPGTITVRTGFRAFTAAELQACAIGRELPPGDFVFLEVTDTGSGMSPETLARIFEPFFTTKFAGRGLGLAAVLGIVRSHGGALQVESEPGRGTRFALLLPPAAPNAAPAHLPTANDGTWRHSGAALVVDDEEPVRNITARLLKTFGLHSVTAPDGEQALALFKSSPQRFEVAVIDLIMPGLTGEETLIQLRQIRPDLRVLIISGYCDKLDSTAASSTSAPTEFLQKPFTREALEKKLRTLWGTS
ncbi:MAG: CHASE domain-containing protein [Opitutae bacterium]|nr:CHASE domain-containing protein [Opitutae bacterium]